MTIILLAAGQESSSPLDEGSFVRVSPTGANHVRIRRDSAVEHLTLARQAVLNSSRSQQSPLSRVSTATESCSIGSLSHVHLLCTNATACVDVKTMEAITGRHCIAHDRRCTHSSCMVALSNTASLLHVGNWFPQKSKETTCCQGTIL